MRQTHSHHRLPAAWLLITLAVLVALTAPTMVGPSAMLAALVFAGAAGYTLGHHELPGIARPRTRTAFSASRADHDSAERERVYRSFDHIAVLPMTGALERLRVPRQR